jgi:predicted nuclease of predicted toxin-antitoxin system
MSEWRFLVDENLEPRIAMDLRKEDYYAEAVQNVDELGKGTPDSEIIDYADEYDLIVVTNNLQDFAHATDRIDVLGLTAGRVTAFEIAGAILDVIDQYDQFGGREAFAFDYVDDYL